MSTADTPSPRTRYRPRLTRAFAALHALVCGASTLDDAPDPEPKETP